MELTTHLLGCLCHILLFMMSKIQKLNGTHNTCAKREQASNVVYDVKDTKIEWNSQLYTCNTLSHLVVYDVKDTKIEWNSQQFCD